MVNLKGASSVKVWLVPDEAHTMQMGSLVVVAEEGGGRERRNLKQKRGMKRRIGSRVTKSWTLPALGRIPKPYKECKSCAPGSLSQHCDPVLVGSHRLMNAKPVTLNSSQHRRGEGRQPR